MSKISDLVRNTCKEVTDEADYVSINMQKLEELADRISSKPVYLDYFDCSFHMQHDQKKEDLVAYVFVMDCLNFCFW